VAFRERGIGFIIKPMEKQQRKHLAIAISLAGVVALLTGLSLLNPLLTPAHTGEDWMEKVPDDRLLSQLSIPGSHDSGALYSVGDLSGKCQDSTIWEQLLYGVRFFDVRLYNYNDSLLVCHNFIDENLAFSDLVHQAVNFLESYPKEGLLISVKHEGTDSGATKSFESLLQEEIAKNSTYWSTGRDLPATLGAIRGKMTLISRYADNTIGLDAYGSGSNHWMSDVDGTGTFSLNQFRVQDHYKVSDNETKWSEITSLLSEAEKDSSNSLLYLNFFSGYLTKGFPPSYSMSTAKVINPKVLSGALPKAHPGVLICDFVTPELAKALWEGNL
jgi:1-phosphatidylinositol phosphodiesterase